jgi:AcrR family transcriptional regulator
MGYSLRLMVNAKDPIPVTRKRGRPARDAFDAAAGIRKAALVAFARAGFNGASVLEIARAAGVAKPLVHYHYASKEALWQAAVGEALGTLQVEMQAALRTSDQASTPQLLLKGLAHQLVLFASRYPDLVRIVVDETGKGGTRAQWLYQAYLLPSYALGQSVIRSVVQGIHPAAKAPAAEHLVPTVLGVMNFPFLEAELIAKAYGKDVYSKAYLARQSEVLYRVLLVLLDLAIPPTDLAT